MGLAALLELYLKGQERDPTEQSQVRLQDFLPWAAQTLGPLSDPDADSALLSRRAAFDKAFCDRTGLDAETLDYLRETCQHPEQAIQLVFVWPALQLARVPPAEHALVGIRLEAKLVFADGASSSVGCELAPASPPAPIELGMACTGVLTAARRISSELAKQGLDALWQHDQDQLPPSVDGPFVSVIDAGW
jgi:hypothetical protein